MASAPRGLGLYRRAGRDGFFFIKNLSAQSKKHPGRIKPAYIDEQIKRGDGVLITSQKEAENYCYRRNAHIQDMLLSLEGEHIAYSGADLEAIAQQLATQWINNKQRGLNLQNLQAERWKLIVRYGTKGVAEWMREQGSRGLVAMADVVTGNGLPLQRQKPIRPEELEEEAEKIHALCWENGFRPDEDGLELIVKHFSKLIEGHLDKSVEARKQGRIRPPKPAFEERSTTWQGLLKAKEEEGIAPGTLNGMAKSVERLEEWCKAHYSLHLPGTIDADVAKRYRSWMFSGDAGLSSSSVGKEFRFLNSVFNAAVKQQLLEENPFHNLPKDRRATMQQKVDARKTVDLNKVMSQEETQAIHERMIKNKRGKRDSGFELFYLQAVTGTRIQEVAGLRRCDFTERTFNGQTYRCIDIRRWSQRGLAVLGDRGGLKNPQSERIVPLPECARAIWEKLSDPKSREPAFPGEAPRSANAHWGDNLARRMRDKIPTFGGTHCWRETMINNLLNNAVPTRIVEMVTGKTGNTPLSQYTSDDLPSMARAVELHAKYLNLPPATRENEMHDSEQAEVSRDR